MFIKLFIICMFIPSIIIDANDSRNFMGKPILENVTRGGKFLGLFAVPKRPIFPLYLTKNKHWRGALILSLGGYPLIATSVEYNHVHTKDPWCFFCLQHPQQINTLVNQLAHQPPPEYLGNDGITTVNDINSHVSSSQPTQYDPLFNPAELPLNATSISVSATASLTTKPNATTMRIKESLRTMKLEDYDAITFDPNSGNDIKDVDESGDDGDKNRVRREIQDLRQESNDENMESTTVESSAQETTTRQEDFDASNDATTLELPQKPSQDFIATTASTIVTTESNKHPSYPPSKYPNAQFISIAHEPQDTYGFLPQIQQPVKNYYNFYPSQPDLSYYYRYNGFVPYCYANYGQQVDRFMPSAYYGGWANGAVGVQGNYLRK